MAIRTNNSIGKVQADMSSWIVDITGSYRLGPLLLEARGVYTPGNEARDNIAKSVRYYQPLNMDAGYWGGWGAILASGVDYGNSGYLTNMGRHIGYDRYGRGAFGLRATYSFTPALALYTTVSPNWTAEPVDTDTGVAGAHTGGGTITRTTVSQNSWVEGDSNYLGTEVDLGLTWRFSANTAFDLQGAYLFSGSALDTAECLGTVSTAGACSGQVVKRDAEDAWMIAARVRLAF